MTSSDPAYKPASAVSFSASSGDSGFVPVPRSLFDLALCHDLGKRELRLFLLVIRLTYGCRGNAWAALRPGDLGAIGIHSSHARLCLRRLVETGLVLRDGDSHRYRANPRWMLENTDCEEDGIVASLVLLNRLVGRHIGRSRRLSSTGTLPVAKEALREPQAQRTAGNAQRIVPAEPALPDTDRAINRWRFDPVAGRFHKQASSVPILQEEISPLQPISPSLRQTAQMVFSTED